MKAALASLLLLAVGCGSPVKRGGDHDLGPPAGSDLSPACAFGDHVCDGTMLSVCSDTGTLVPVEDCAERSDACMPGVGCVACTPGATQCSANAASIETCAADGSAFAPTTNCDTASGEVCQDGACINRCNNNTLSYLGCEYLASVTANSQLDVSFTFAVVLANPQPYQIQATITGGALGSGSKVVQIAAQGAAGDVQTVELPWVASLMQKRPNCYVDGAADPLDCTARSSLAINGAYHIQTNGPIAAYQFNALHYEETTFSGVKYSYTNDASLLLPTVGLAKHYLVAAYGNWTNDTLGPLSDPVMITSGGFAAIVGIKDATAVTVFLSATTWDPMNEALELAPGQHDFTLNAGDVLQLVGKKMGEDMTGTRIVASDPIAVFSGHDCTQIPFGRPACDHLEEQLLPQENWGKSYAVSPLRIRAPDEVSIVRIMSQANANQLVFDGIDTPPECAAPLAIGTFCEFTTGTPFQVTGNAPILVSQFMRGQGDPPHKAEICAMHSSDSECQYPFGSPESWCDDHATDPLCEGFIAWCANNPTSPSCQGDPAMVIEVPTAQFRASYDILVPSTYPINRINVVAPTASMVTIDGDPVATFANVQASPIGTGYTLYVLAPTSGQHHLETADGTYFGVKIYGVATYTSYIYSGGMDLQPLVIF